MTTPGGRLDPGVQESVDRDGSPEFNFSVGVLAAGASTIINPAVLFVGAATYHPLNRLVVINNSGEEIHIIINGIAARRTRVPAGTIATIKRSIDTCRILNNDGANATSADEVDLTFSRDPLDADELARRYGR